MSNKMVARNSVTGYIIRVSICLWHTQNNNRLAELNRWMWLINYISTSFNYGICYFPCMGAVRQRPDRKLIRFSFSNAMLWWSLSFNLFFLSNALLQWKYSLKGMLIWSTNAWTKVKTCAHNLVMNYSLFYMPLAGLEASIYLGYQILCQIIFKKVEKQYLITLAFEYKRICI